MKKATHLVGVAAQYASALGKTANCQTLVSLTLTRGVMLALRLFLPKSWTRNRVHLWKPWQQWMLNRAQNGLETCVVSTASESPHFWAPKVPHFGGVVISRWQRRLS
jgi:hypothetical protein